MLTDAIVTSLQPKPGARQWIKSDHDKGDDPGKTCRGFGCKVMASGRKTYIVSYYFGGNEREYVVGDAKDVKCAAARKKAREVRQKAKDGIDPQGERVLAREAPTIKILAARYEEEHLPKKRPGSQRNDRTMLRQWIVPQLGSMKVAAVRPRDIEDLHRKITKAGTPIVANRVVALLSKLFSLAIRWDWRGPNDNPVKNAVERNTETQRKVYLKPEQITRLSEALAAYPDWNVADAVRLLLLTGARRSEVLGARWDQFDLERGRWVKPASTTKQAQEHEVPLSAPALELLVRRRAVIKGDYVFPGRGTLHLTEIKKGWASLCKVTGLDGVRVHDLRHTAASILVSGGATLPMIGALLGHSQISTTNRYAHLYSDPLREAAERLGIVVTGRKGAIVIDLPNKAGTPR
jgi:integrase